MQGPNPLGPILISVLKLGSNVTKKCITNKMVSAIREQGQNEGLRIHEQNHHNDSLHLGSSAYSLFILAIRSPQTNYQYFLEEEEKEGFESIVSCHDRICIEC